MGAIKDQIKAQFQQKIKDSVALSQAQKTPPKKTVGGFLSNASRNVTEFAKGIVGLGYQAVRHPIESAKNVGSAVVEVAKNIPRSVMELGKKTLSPIQSTKEGIDAFKALKSISYEDQKKLFNEITEKTLQTEERGKRIAGVFGSGLIGATTSELTHPLEYGYDNPFNMALDALTLGQATGATKVISGAIKPVLSKVPAVAKIESALKEVFTPNGKLVVNGYEDLAKDLTKTKSEIFKTQRQIIDDTATKFNKELALTPKEQTEFFETIDKARRTTENITSPNPKIQTAIDWWLKEEVPALAKASGLPQEKAIQNYLHHFFPEKFKGKELTLGKPLQFAKKGYLKKSQDVEGFTKDPVLSISAIKSKVAIDNLKDSFIRNTIDKYAVKTKDISKQLTDAGVDITNLNKTQIVEKAKQVLNLEEYKPKGSLKFFPVVTEKGSKVVGVSKRVETHLLPKVIAEELNKFTGGGKSTLDKMFLPFDVFNRNWKPLATAVRPRYHTRNIIGNLYNAVVVGKTNIKEIPIALLNQVKDHIGKSIASDNLLGKIYKPIFGKNPPSSDVMKLAIDNDVIGRGFFGADLNDLTTAVDKGDDIMKMIKSINTPAEIYKIPILKQWLTLSQKVGQFLEDNARLAMFQQGLKRFKGDVGLSKEFVDKHLFDYITGLGEADKIIKRFIPFWSWTRFNVPLQLGAIKDMPLRNLAIQKGSQPYTKATEIGDEGYQYLSEQEKEYGYIKTGTTQKGGKEYDTYIKTASVLPVADISRLVRIFQGQDEEIGITPLKQIYDLISKDPTKFKDFFGQPIEQFIGEKKKFLGTAVTGKTKALLSTIPALTELNKLIAGSYTEKETPELNIRLEQVLSPVGLTLVDKESNKFYREIEKSKELTGSYVSGLESIYKRNLKLDMENKGKEGYISDNVKTLEKILQEKGLNKLDLLKIRTKAIKALLQDAISGK